MALEPGADEFERIALPRLEDNVGPSRIAQHAPDAGASGFDALGASQTDEGVAAEALATDNGLEQVGIGAAGERCIDGKGGVQIGARLGEHRDTAVARLGELKKMAFGHNSLRAQLRLLLGTARKRLRN